MREKKMKMMEVKRERERRLNNNTLRLSHSQGKEKGRKRNRRMLLSLIRFLLFFFKWFPLCFNSSWVLPVKAASRQSHWNWSDTVEKCVLQHLLRFPSFFSQLQLKPHHIHNHRSQGSLGFFPHSFIFLFTSSSSLLPVYFISSYVLFSKWYKFS